MCTHVLSCMAALCSCVLFRAHVQYAPMYFRARIPSTGMFNVYTGTGRVDKSVVVCFLSPPPSSKLIPISSRTPLPCALFERAFCHWTRVSGLPSPRITPTSPRTPLPSALLSGVCLSWPSGLFGLDGVNDRVRLLVDAAWFGVRNGLVTASVASLPVCIVDGFGFSLTWMALMTVSVASAPLGSAPGMDWRLPRVFSLWCAMLACLSCRLSVRCRKRRLHSSGGGLLYARGAEAKRVRHGTCLPCYSLRSSLIFVFDVWMNSGDRVDEGRSRVNVCAREEGGTKRRKA